MAMTQASNLFISVGKQIKDEYGRTIGKVASFAVNPNGKFDAVFIKQGDGRFLKYSAENIKVDDNGEVSLISRVKMTATGLYDQIPLIWRKDQALRQLVEKKKISTEMYEDLHNSFDGALNQLKSEAQKIMEEIEKETVRCAREIKELNFALVHLEIEREIGKIDQQSYQTAFLIIQESLKKANIEKNDLEAMKNKLSNTLLGENTQQVEREAEEETEKEAIEEEETTAQEAPAAQSPNLPEPPVVVYVKEAGKSNA
jgi:hypothetical protein